MKVVDTRDGQIGWVKHIQFSETQGQHVLLVEVKTKGKRLLVTWRIDHCEVVE